MKKNILVLDAGGPGSMAALKIINDSGLPVKTVACDMDPSSPAQLLADIFVTVPVANSPSYQNAVKDTMAQHAIDFVVPSFHFGFDKLQYIQSDAFITDFKKGIICHDKLKFYELCLGGGLSVPQTQLFKNVKKIHEPSYIKPRFGAGSKNNFTCMDNESFIGLKSFLGDMEDYIVQTLLGGEHWSVEGYVENGVLLACTCFIIRKSSAGNPSCVEIKNNPDLVTFTDNLQKLLGLKAAFNLEVFIDENGEITIIELNPRYGSGIAFSALAGCSSLLYAITSDKSYLKESKEGIYVRYLEAARLVNLHK